VREREREWMMKRAKMRMRMRRDWVGEFKRKIEDGSDLHQTTNYEIAETLAYEEHVGVGYYGIDFFSYLVDLGVESGVWTCSGRSHGFFPLFEGCEVFCVVRRRLCCYALEVGLDEWFDVGGIKWES
jgi:hypothetical protein